MADLQRDPTWHFQYPFSGFFLFFTCNPNHNYADYCPFNIHFQDSSFSSSSRRSAGGVELASVSFQYPFSGFFLFFMMWNEAAGCWDYPPFNIHFQDSSFSSIPPSTNRARTGTFQYPFSGFFLFFLIEERSFSGVVVFLSISIFRILPFLQKNDF